MTKTKFYIADVGDAIVNGWSWPFASILGIVSVDSPPGMKRGECEADGCWPELCDRYTEIKLTTYPFYFCSLKASPTFPALLDMYWVLPHGLRRIDRQAN